MQLEVEIVGDDWRVEYNVSEFTRSRHRIKSVKFDKPEFQITLTKQSFSSKCPDKIISVSNELLPSYMFGQYRDGYTTLIIESNVSGIITIEYEKDKPLFTSEEIQRRKEIEENSKKYYTQYYDILPDGSLFIKNLDTLEIHPDERKLMELISNNHGKELVLNTLSITPRRNGDVYTSITVDSSVNTTLSIYCGERIMQEINIKKGICKYNTNYIMHFVCPFSRILYKFNDVVNSVEFDVLFLPNNLRDPIRDHQNIVIDSNYKYVDGIHILGLLELKNV